MIQSIFQKIISFDEKFMSWMSQIKIPPLTFFLKILTQTARGLFWFISAFILWILIQKNIFIFNGQIQILQAMSLAFIAWVVGSLLKKLIKRKRPVQKILGFRPKINISEQNDSFPSNHTSSSTAFFFALVFICHPLVPFVGMWAFLIAFSRFYLGVHFLTDIIAGGLLGFFCSYFFYSFFIF